MNEFKRDASKCSHSDHHGLVELAQQATTVYSPGRGRLRGRVQGEYELDLEVKRKSVMSRNLTSRGPTVAQHTRCMDTFYGTDLTKIFFVDWLYMYVTELHDRSPVLMSLGAFNY